MDNIYKEVAINNLREFTRKRVLEEEVIKGAKQGIKKLEAVENNFWEKAEEYVKNSKKVNNEYIPDAVEGLAEDLILEAIKVFKEELQIRPLIESIVQEEKQAIGI